jgi:hypothetical protein
LGQWVRGISHLFVTVTVTSATIACEIESKKLFDVTQSLDRSAAPSIA